MKAGMPHNSSDILLSDSHAHVRRLSKIVEEGAWDESTTSRIEGFIKRVEKKSVTLIKRK